jgi:hypothetical protein
MRERLVERAIRQYGAMIPTVDVAKVLKLRKAESSEVSWNNLPQNRR